LRFLVAQFELQALLLHRGNSGRILTAMLQNRQGVKKVLIGRFRAIDDAHDSAHIRSEKEYRYFARTPSK